MKRVVRLRREHGMLRVLWCVEVWPRCGRSVIKVLLWRERRQTDERRIRREGAWRMHGRDRGVGFV
jgi:hypothetical protein